MDLADSILSREITWIDWKAMPLEARKQWSGDARSALQNRCIQHLIGKSASTEPVATTGEISKRCMENVARYAKDHRETENIRHIMCGAELVKELLEEMLLSDQSKESVEEPHSVL